MFKMPLNLLTCATPSSTHTHARTHTHTHTHTHMHTHTHRGEIDLENPLHEQEARRLFDSMLQALQDVSHMPFNIRHVHVYCVQSISNLR